MHPKIVLKPEYDSGARQTIVSVSFSTCHGEPWKALIEPAATFLSAIFGCSHDAFLILFCLVYNFSHTLKQSKCQMFSVVLRILSSTGCGCGKGFVAAPRSLLLVLVGLVCLSPTAVSFTFLPANGLNAKAGSRGCVACPGMSLTRVVSWTRRWLRSSFVFASGPFCVLLGDPWRRQTRVFVAIGCHWCVLVPRGSFHLWRGFLSNLDVWRGLTGMVHRFIPFPTARELQ